MPTITYDFNEASEFAEFVVLEPGNVVFKFKSADGSQKSKSGAKKVIVDLIVSATAPANEWAIGGMVRQHWPTSGAGAGRFRDFLAALGYNFKDKGSLKLEKYYDQEVGARVTRTAGATTDESGNPVFFNDLRSLMPGEQMRGILGVTDEEEEEAEDEEEIEEPEDEEEEEDEDEGDEEEEDEDEDEDDDEEEDEEDEEELSPEDLKSMSLAELKELAESYDISIKVPKGKKLTSALLRKRLLVLWEEEESEEEEDPF